MFMHLTKHQKKFDVLHFQWLLFMRRVSSKVHWMADNYECRNWERTPWRMSRWMRLSVHKQTEIERTDNLMLKHFCNWLSQCVVMRRIACFLTEGEQMSFGWKKNSPRWTLWLELRKVFSHCPGNLLFVELRIKISHRREMKGTVKDYLSHVDTILYKWRQEWNIAAF